ncbi:hypothetical protein ABW19_dt0209351 [Dactylella cylindrospora]|nr:hypothetical protein ABW19_dt0209351 [Dactylella cylindrospora]
MGLFGKNHMPVAGRNIILTGASQGMGKELALLLAAEGANLSIIARDEKKLEAARAEIQAVMDGNTTKYPSQKLAIISTDLTSPTSVAAAVKQSESLIGETEILWCCAGGTHPGYFQDFSPSDLQWEMNSNYFSAVYITQEVFKLMISRPPPLNRKLPYQRKLIVTSSLAALCPTFGYTAYVGAKAALRAFADSLRQECLLYDIGVHCCCPGTMVTPGFEVEEMTKPPLAKLLDAGDVVQTPGEVAKELLRELQKGEDLPITNFQARAARASMAGPTGRVDTFFEILLSWAAVVVYLFVRSDQNGIVLKERKEKGLPWAKKT